MKQKQEFILKQLSNGNYEYSCKQLGRQHTIKHENIEKFLTNLKKSYRNNKGNIKMNNKKQITRHTYTLSFDFQPKHEQTVNQIIKILSHLLNLFTDLNRTYLEHDLTEDVTNEY